MNLNWFVIYLRFGDPKICVNSASCRLFASIVFILKCIYNCRTFLLHFLSSSVGILIIRQSKLGRDPGNYDLQLLIPLLFSFSLSAIQSPIPTLVWSMLNAVLRVQSHGPDHFLVHCSLLYRAPSYSCTINVDWMQQGETWTGLVMWPYANTQGGGSHVQKCVEV